LGCRSFAVLFDDIEPDLCLADKMEYSSSADAQATLTNKVFDWFGDLRTVLFCPTGKCLIIYNNLLSDIFDFNLLAPL